MEVWYKVHNLFCEMLEFPKMPVITEKYSLSDPLAHCYKAQNNMFKIKPIIQAWMFYNSQRKIMN